VVLTADGKANGRVVSSSVGMRKDAKCLDSSSMRRKDAKLLVLRRDTKCTRERNAPLGSLWRQQEWEQPEGPTSPSTTRPMSSEEPRFFVW
jgi:hypothetical protein